jgi:hypothetical protein
MTHCVELFRIWISSLPNILTVDMFFQSAAIMQFVMRVLVPGFSSRYADVK